MIKPILEKGSYVIKEGFVKELDREILGAIFPIKGEDGLLGFIYIYVPLAAIQDVFRGSIPLLVIVGVLIFLYTLFSRQSIMAVFIQTAARSSTAFR